MAIENSEWAIIASVKKDILPVSVSEAVLNEGFVQFFRILLDISYVRVATI